MESDARRAKIRFHAGPGASPPTRVARRARAPELVAGNRESMSLARGFGKGSCE